VGLGLVAIRESVDLWYILIPGRGIPLVRGNKPRTLLPFPAAILVGFCSRDIARKESKVDTQAVFQREIIS
jgi:hypothetical protein